MFLDKTVFAPAVCYASQVSRLSRLFIQPIWFPQYTDYGYASGVYKPSKLASIQAEYPKQVSKPGITGLFSTGDDVGGCAARSAVSTQA